MILIYEERTKRFIDVKILQRKIIGHIKDYRKEIDDKTARKEGCHHIFVDENLDLITEYESELQYLKEMQKVPFDVLVVIQEVK